MPFYPIVALALVAGTALWWALRSLIGGRRRQVPFAAALFCASAGFLLWLTVSPRAIVHAPPPTAYAAGVPFRPLWVAVQAETPGGQPMLADAGATPLLFVAPTPAGAKVVAQVTKTLIALKTYRPVMVVGTHFTDPALARTAWDRWVAHYHVTLPTVIQEGPPTWYAPTVPLLVVEWKNHLVRKTGTAAIAAWLHAHAGIRILPPHSAKSSS